MRRMEFVSRVLLTFLVLTLACSTDSTNKQGAELSLVIGNTDVRSVQYDIVCEGGATFTDEFEVVDDRDPPVWEAFVGLPAGEDCVITLTAFDDAGNPICTGSTTVTIIEGQTVKADITMECPTTGEIGTGSVDIDGTFEDIVVEICPIIHILNAIPRVMTEPPGESSLRVQATDPVTGAEVDTVLSSTSGIIDDPSSKNTGFTCTQSGPVEVTATAAAGDPNCEQRATTTLSCPDTGDLCDGVDCGDGNECTSDICNPADGSCSNPSLPDGTSCDGGAGSCQSGACVPADLCEGVDCGDGNECTSDVCDPADGSCSNPNVADGTACSGGSCQAGECVPDAPEPQTVVADVSCTLPLDFGEANVAVDLVVSPASAWSTGSTVDVAFEASTVIPASIGQLLIDLGTDQLVITGLEADLSVGGGTPTPVQVLLGGATFDVDIDDDGNAEDLPIDIPVPNELITNDGAAAVGFTITRFVVALTDVPLLSDITVADTQPPSDIPCTLVSSTASFPVQ